MVARKRATRLDNINAFQAASKPPPLVVVIDWHQGKVEEVTNFQTKRKYDFVFGYDGPFREFLKSFLPKQKALTSKASAEKAIKLARARVPGAISAKVYYGPYYSDGGWDYGIDVSKADKTGARVFVTFLANGKILTNVTKRCN